MTTPSLGPYSTDYDNTPDCTTCEGGANCKTLYTTVEISSKDWLSTVKVQLAPGQSYTYDKQIFLFQSTVYGIEIVFNSGEASAYPECTGQPIPGPQPVSDSTIHFYEINNDYCLGSSLLGVTLLCGVLVHVFRSRVKK